MLIFSKSVDVEPGERQLNGASSDDLRVQASVARGPVRGGAVLCVRKAGFAVGASAGADRGVERRSDDGGDGRRPRRQRRLASRPGPRLLLSEGR
jgi:hypothetical protein